MPASIRDVLDSADFRQMVRLRWQVSLVLCALLFLMYYGFIVLVATNKPLLAMKIGAATTLGIPLGAGVIIGAWVLTAIYVVWANRAHDDEVRRLRDRLR